MNRLVAIALLILFPVSASAVEHMDAIQVKLTGCSVDQYAKLATDFNEQWGSKHGYRAQVAAPVQSEDLTHVFWLGRSANAAAFGAAWDAWRTELGDPKSAASKLNARFLKCGDNVTRSGYDVY